MNWNSKRIERAKRILSRHPRDRYADALVIIGRELGEDVTSSALRHAFQRHGEEHPPSWYCAGDDDDDVDSGPDTSRTGVHAPSFDQLVALTRKGPVAFESLCDALDMSPSKARALIEQAKASGVRVRVEHGHVGVAPAQPSDDRVQAVGIAPVVGKRQRVGVISDLHLGSKWCLREQLRDFVHYAYEQGVREILCPGDVLDGAYHRHGLYELSHVGIDAQAQDLFETLPQLPGLHFRCITGNHDETLTLNCGVDVGHFLEAYFQKRGRNDLHFYGNRGAVLKVAGAVVHLWHPLKGPAYAKTYGLQKQAEKYTSIKPQILLAGHWHVFAYCLERGIHCIACPTFQGGGSAFGNALGGAPAIGGLLLGWTLTEHGTLRDFEISKRSYYERERPIDVFNDVDAIPVDRRRA